MIWPVCLIKWWWWKEKLDACHYWGSKCLKRVGFWTLNNFIEELSGFKTPSEDMSCQEWVAGLTKTRVGIPANCQMLLFCLAWHKLEMYKCGLTLKFENQVTIQCDLLNQLTFLTYGSFHQFLRNGHFWLKVLNLYSNLAVLQTSHYCVICVWLQMKRKTTIIKLISDEWIIYLIINKYLAVMTRGQSVPYLCKSKKLNDHFCNEQNNNFYWLLVMIELGVPCLW